MKNQSYAQVADQLEVFAREVRNLEKRAKEALYENNDQAGYEELMRGKALLLSSMIDDFDYLKNDETQESQFIVDKISDFSNSATTALNVGSVFFMSALLYNDDYTEGEPNNLELFISEIRSK